MSELRLPECPSAWGPKRATSKACASSDKLSLTNRLQEKAFGALKPSTRRLLARVAEETAAGPALQGLLSDINQGLIDIVVVYKVDRLTRSLSDFAKMVEVFDARGVSFVAVTQQFNTTTSMGRLTLNVLLSFAQFEREVTGERIRDKIAASKQKGMWMGGLVPLGYDVIDRRLEVNQSEAQKVLEIFRRYLELGSVRLLMEDLNRRSVRSKVRVARNGKPIGRELVFPWCALRASFESHLHR